MRIISGKYRSRVIRMPKGIRPTQDKVRKALFDILGDIAGLSFLELFAGSGAVGIEALSKGAQEVIFVEKARECVKTIEDNLALLRCLSFSSVIASDADKAIEKMSQQRKKFEIIFLDPPYYGGLSKKTLQSLGACDILAPDGLVVVQHFKQDNLPDAAGDLTLLRQKKYGDTVLSFYRKYRLSGKSYSL